MFSDNIYPPKQACTSLGALKFLIKLDAPYLIGLDH